MSKELTGLPKPWLSRNFGMNYYCDDVPMCPPYAELREQNDILGVLYRSQVLITIPRFQRMQRAGMVCYETTKIVVNFLRTFEPDYRYPIQNIRFDHPILGGVAVGDDAQIIGNHVGQIVAGIMKPGNPYIGIVDMASHLFGWKEPILASGHIDHIHEILSYLYSLHQPDPVTVSKLQIAGA